MGTAECNILQLMGDLQRQAEEKVAEFTETLQARFDWLESVKRQAAELTARSAKNPTLLAKTPTAKRTRKGRIASVSEATESPTPAARNARGRSSVAPPPTEARAGRATRASRAVSLLPDNQPKGSRSKRKQGNSGMDSLVADASIAQISSNKDEIEEVDTSLSERGRGGKKVKKGHTIDETADKSVVPDHGEQQHPIIEEVVAADSSQQAVRENEGSVADVESEGEEAVRKAGRKVGRLVRSMAGSRKRSRAPSPRQENSDAAVNRSQMVSAVVAASPVPAPRTHLPAASTSTDSETEMVSKPAKPVRATRSKQKRSGTRTEDDVSDRPSKLPKVASSSATESSETEQGPPTETAAAPAPAAAAVEDEEEQNRRMTRTINRTAVAQSDGPSGEQPRGGRVARTKVKQADRDMPPTDLTTSQLSQDRLMATSGQESSAEEEETATASILAADTTVTLEKEPVKLRGTGSKEKVKETSTESSSAPDSDKENTRPQRSTRTKQRNQMDVSAASVVEAEDTARPARSTRTKQRQMDVSSASNVSSSTEPEEGGRPARSTRTKQKQIVQEQQQQQLASPPQPPVRSTRTKQRLLNSAQEQLAQEVLTRSAASPRVRELAQRALSPATRAIGGRQPGGSPHSVPYTGSPVRDRVKQFGNAMRESAGLRPRLSGVSKAQRRSSVAQSLRKVSAAHRTSLARVVAEQLPLLQVATGEAACSPPALDQSRSTSRPAAKKFGKFNKVMASGGRGVSPAVGSGKSGLSSGSSSSAMRKFKSRIDMIAKATGGPSSNMVKDPAMKSFLPSKPKGPTPEEIQELKEQERRRKEEKEEEARRRREELMKKKAEEQKEKREERCRRVQEARQQNENQRENRIRTNQAKENEEKLAALKKREERQREEAEKKRKETEMRLRQAEERRKKEEEEKKRVKAEEEATRLREEEKKKQRQREEEERRKEQQRREEARIQRERDELRKIKEREAEKAAKENMNYTSSKPADTTFTLEKTANSTYQKDTTQDVNSYDMTPARHELPPEPSKNEDDYGIDDLNSGEDTDDDENPRKQIPKWAEGAALRTALLKQSYMPPDLDLLFEIPTMPDLSDMFAEQRRRFFKRTSSAVWKSPPSSFKHDLV